MQGPAAHRRAAILSVGDELVLGQTLDTNSRWLSSRLAEAGVPVVEHVTAPDDLDRLAGALRRLASAVDLVVVTGGLGPTLDDLTRPALARVMNEPLVEDAALLEQIRSMFARAAIPMAESNRVQAQRPRSAEGLPNPTGSAPGLAAAVRTGGEPADVFCLPGPPGEMRPMFDAYVQPRLRPPAGRVVRTTALHTFGIGEAALAERLGALMDRDRNPLVGTTASQGVVTCRVRFEGAADDADRAMAETERLVLAAASPFVYGRDGESLADAALRELERRAERLVVVESCTGGLLGAMITEVPGSSASFLGGWITYSNELKESEVGVPEDLLRAHGAVSAEVARAMAERPLLRDAGAGAHHALAITGVAGPSGGTAAKPVGTVFIARASRRAGAPGGFHTEVRRFLFVGDRSLVRHRSALSALAMLRFYLVGAGVRGLLRERPLGG